MEPIASSKITALFRSEPRLEKVIQKLTEKAVAHHDISVQDAPQKIINTFGVNTIDSMNLQNNQQTPTKEPFLSDDRNLLISFSFSIPLFIGLVIGVFIIGDVRILADNIIFGFLGAVIGGVVGFICSKYVRRISANKTKFQQKNGGFLLWVTVHDNETVPVVMDILKKHNAENITLTQ